MTSSSRRALYLIAVITFFTFAARGFVLPFINIYLKSTGFTATQIGLLVSVSAFIQLLVTPLLHTLADRSHKHRRLYYGLLVSNALALVGVVSHTSQLFLGGAIVVRDSSDAPSASLLSQLTITWLDTRKMAIYGRLRAFGSFGWAVATLVSGRIFALGGYPLLFILAAVFNLILLPFVRVFPEHTTAHTEQTHSAPSRSRVFYIYLLSVFLFYVGANAISAFSFIYFQENLGASNEIIGIISSVSALAEIPSMIFMDRILRRTNIRTALAIGAMGQAILWIGYTLLAGPILLIPLMIIRGTFYTFYNVSATLLVARISHPSNVATNQALAQVTVPGIAILLTTWGGGWLFDNAGPHFLFQLAAFVGILAACLVLLIRKQLAAEVSRMQIIREETSAAV
ncbi:MAG: MFS transporter [Chloroflexi bacterium]|nr:MFS transporter [Chloroflexota bacterium]MCC6891716.1 MFS transporter [Anaerolineae bacterium]